MECICIWSRKGGNGKTTIAANLAYELAAMGYRVLAIDADSQMDMTTTLCGGQESAADIYTAVTGQSGAWESICRTDYGSLDIICGSPYAEELERILGSCTPDVAMNALSDIILPVSGAYDFAVIDTDKSTGLLNQAVLCASDHVIVPCEPSFYNVKAIFPAAERIKRTGTDLLGLVYNKVVERKSETRRAEEDVEQLFEWPVFDTRIPMDAAVEKSQRECLPLGAYTKRGRARQAFRDLAAETVRRINGQEE